MLVSIRSLCSAAVAGFLFLNTVPAYSQAQAQFPLEESEPANAAPAATTPPSNSAATPPGSTTPPPNAAATAPTAASPHYKDLPDPEQPKREDIREADANADRVILLPTAETHPKGRLYFSAHEVIFWQLGYAFTDRIQATVTTWPVIVRDQPFFIDGSFKANFYRSDIARLALAGGVTYVASTVDTVNNTASVGRLALMGQLCVTRGCWTSVVGGLSAWVPLSQGTGSLYAGGIGVTSKLSKYVGLLFEVDSGAFYDQELRFAEGALVNYGVRFAGSNIGVDLTMLKPAFSGANDDLVMGIPWISFTYRTDPLSD